MATKKPEPPSPEELRKTTAWVTLFMTIVDRVGWPGLLVIGFFAVLFGYGSIEQKREFIDIYILGKGIQGVWPIVLLSAIFAATVVAQLRVYGRKIALLEKELERVGNEKSELQQELTPVKCKRGKQKEDGKP